jgi:hypothetical protein
MKVATDRNKLFRSHCNIEVTLNKEDNCASVQISYKPELLEMPLSEIRHVYRRNDVVEELTRQGIAVDVSSAAPLHIDNSTVGHRRQQYLEAEFVFKLAPAPAKALSQELGTKQTTKHKSTKTKTSDQ